jgi:hypothetical protein
MELWHRREVSAVSYFADDEQDDHDEVEIRDQEIRSPRLTLVQFRR